MSSASDRAFSHVADALLIDADDDVRLEGGALSVKGRVFARLDGDRLVVDLPSPRAADLVERGIASSASGTEAALGTWVGIDEAEDWIELAGEAHQFVGEPPVGRQS